MDKTSKIKIENFKAQYRSILGNIRSANTELEGLFDSIQLKGDELKLVKLNLQGESFTLTKLRDLRHNITVNIEGLRKSQTRDLERVRNELSKLTSSINLKRKILKDESTKRISLVEERVISKKTELLKLEGIVVRVSKEVAPIERKIKLLLKTVNKSSEELENLSKLLVERTKLYSNVEKDIKIQGTLLVGIKGQVKSETLKIKAPMLNLSEREKRLEEKERNFQILTLRWRRFFEEHFPGQKLKL